MTEHHNLDGAFEQYLLARDSGQGTAFGDLVTVLKKVVKADQSDKATTILQRIIQPTLDYSSAMSLQRIFTQIPDRSPHTTQSIKLAILGSTTTRQLAQLIELYLFAHGIDAQIYEADYGVFRQEILDPQSQLYAFEPDVIFFATSWRELAHLPETTDSPEIVEQKVQAELEDWSSLWEKARDRLGCQILQNNFAPPPWRLLDNYEMRHPSGLGRFIAQVNQVLTENAPAHVTIHDIDHLSASVGRWAWEDGRFFHHAKLPCAPEYLVDYAHNVASLMAAGRGLGKKCLVLDLDNTLWGGVIGDDGPGGIRLGQGDAEGEACQEFQRYIKGLQLRGVILAVCSKNEENIAREVFEKHPEMVLRLEDISCFIANWQDKASNLKTIAEQLNIGLNSMVFVDDNPAERALVRQILPEVAVPELPDDPTGYIQALEKYRYFQMTSISNEDYKRTEFYRGNAARHQAQTSADDLQEYLQSLNMVAQIQEIEPATLERSVQLINRSNQFNLTTRRYSTADVQAVMEDDDWITRTVSLEDRFGNNGLISVLLARIEESALVIDTWLMSCRVFKRGVEDLLMNHIYDCAHQLGLSTIRGEFIPTAKNGLVREHYSKLGFTLTDTEENGRTFWELSVNEDWQPRSTYIKESNENGQYSQRVAGHLSRCV